MLFFLVGYRQHGQAEVTVINSIIFNYDSNKFNQ